jgi:glycosyltransferase involved in cell wall biosynthesis
VSVTAIIPVYGPTYASRKENLENIVESGFEIKLIIVADSFENEEFAELTQMTSKKSRDITLISGNYGNPGSARNAGLEALASEWVCFWDSDDMPNQKNILRMIKCAETEKFTLAKGRYLIENTGNNQVTQSKDEFVEGQNPAKHLLDPGLWRYAFSTKTYKDLRFPPLRMGEDQDFLVQALLSKNPVYETTNIVYIYRVGHTSQLTREKTAFEDTSQSLEFLKDLLKEHKSDEVASDIILISYLKQFFGATKNTGFSNLRIHQKKHITVILTSLFSGALIKPISMVLKEKMKRK